MSPAHGQDDGRRMKKLLIVDDDIGVLNALRRRLRRLQLDITAEGDVNQAIALCQQVQFDLIICDQRMPAMLGTDFLREVRLLQPHASRILLSGHSDFDSVTQAFNDGIIDKFIAKPWDDTQLMHTVQALLGEETQSPESQQVFHQMLSCDSAMHRLFGQISRIASANAPVFVFGETGTGKELVARAIHQESYRRDAPFVAVNCANFNEQLMESELFGHKKGAFTHAVSDRAGLLAEADGGTLFLDEVTTLPLDLQAKLLRVLQEREYRPVGGNQPVSFDVQLISASSTRLSDAVADGAFRADLEYRLEVIPLSLPPLRERHEDILLLFEHYLQELAPERSFTLAPDTQQKLLSYSFPGNVRQLYNMAQYTAAMSEQSLIKPDDLPLHLMAESSSVDTETVEAALKTETLNVEPANKPALEHMGADELAQLLANHNNNRTATATALGISRMTLWRRMSALGLI